jgi:hypothetical protein
MVFTNRNVGRKNMKFYYRRDLNGGVPYVGFEKPEHEDRYTILEGDCPADELPHFLTLESAEWKETQAWAEIRHKRNALLSASDYTQLPDAINGAVWIDYRQTLRTIPQDYLTHDLVVWPTKPKA